MKANLNKMPKLSSIGVMKSRAKKPEKYKAKHVCACGGRYTGEGAWQHLHTTMHLQWNETAQNTVEETHEAQLIEIK